MGDHFRDDVQLTIKTFETVITPWLKVQNDILLAMDRQHVTLLVLLDLSAAFDTVDHRVLLRRLEVTYGITGTALQWFRSYLTGRTQRVYINQT